MEYKNFSEFYVFYLSQHQKPMTRWLHFMGIVLGAGIFSYALLNERYTLILAGPAVGYGLAWVSHLFVEKNRPATFRYPLYSLMGDFVMFRDMLLGKIK